MKTDKLLLIFLQCWQNCKQICQKAIYFSKPLVEERFIYHFIILFRKISTYNNSIS